jgi:uncharacterized protein
MYIHIKLIPNAKKESFEKLDNNHYKISVREPAQRNLANKRLIEIIRKKFSNAKQIKIISGHHSPSKLLSVNTDEKQ